MSANFTIFQCSNIDCMFRCPQSPTDHALEYCPLCGSDGVKTEYDFPSPEESNVFRPHNFRRVEVLLDNLRSVYNVGSVFRTSDGAGISRLYLGGYTSTPDHPKLKKTGLGSEVSVPWEHIRNGLDLVNHKKFEGFQIWSLERNPEAVSLFSPGLKFMDVPILLVIGNEKVGVDPEILKVSDRIVSIPMAGQKRSLNVATAFGIAAYALTLYRAVHSE